MRISDWSSDVCSSDLRLTAAGTFSPPAESTTPAPGGLPYPPDYLSQKIDIELFARPPSPNPNPKPNTFSSSQDDGKQDTWPFILRCTTPSGGPRRATPPPAASCARSEEHTSELQSLMRISYAVFCLKKKTQTLAAI